jgi:DNA-binding transcriptional ArsR family regulator
MLKTHAMFFKILAAHSRVQILKLLRKNDDLTVDDLASQLDVTVPTVSRHLQLMRIQNLVTFRQDAQNRYYEVNKKEIVKQLTSFLQDLDITLPNE